MPKNASLAFLLAAESINAELVCALRDHLDLTLPGALLFKKEVIKVNLETHYLSWTMSLFHFEDSKPIRTTTTALMRNSSYKQAVPDEDVFLMFS